MKNYNDQSIIDWFFSFKYLFVLEKGLLLRKLFDAEKGDGWEDSII